MRKSAVLGVTLLAMGFACAGSSAFTPQATAHIKGSNTGAIDLFGESVALSADGTTLAVGAPGEASAATGINGNQADNSAFLSGAVYVFTRSGISWSQQAYVKASNTGAEDSFGRFVALSADGNTLAVGAPNENSAARGINGNQADDSVKDAGAVYVFTRSGTTWSQQAYIKASNTGISRGFASVALSADGNTLAVGGRGEHSAATGIDGNQADHSADHSGAIYVFTRSGATWSQQAYIKASNTGALDRFGEFVALSANGNTLAVGAWGEDSAARGINGNQADNSVRNAGATYIFTRSGAMWSQQVYIKASNTGTHNSFGTVTLSADGNTLAVGARGPARGDESATGPFVNKAGATYVFTRSGATWSQQAYIKARDNVTGVGLSADGTTLAVGVDEVSAAIENSGPVVAPVPFPAGAVYVFSNTP